MALGLADMHPEECTGLALGTDVSARLPPLLLLRFFDLDPIQPKKEYQSRATPHRSIEVDQTETLLRNKLGAKPWLQARGPIRHYRGLTSKPRPSKLDPIGQ